MKLSIILKKIEITLLEWLFEERKTFTVKLPCSSANEKFRKLFSKKIKDFNEGWKKVYDLKHAKYSPYFIRYSVIVVWCIAVCYVVQIIVAPVEIPKLDGMDITPRKINVFGWVKNVNDKFDPELRSVPCFKKFFKAKDTRGVSH